MLLTLKLLFCSATDNTESPVILVIERHTSSAPCAHAPNAPSYLRLEVRGPPMLLQDIVLVGLHSRKSCQE
eukprot:7620895-Karenia_brevis.AAC.1